MRSNGASTFALETDVTVSGVALHVAAEGEVRFADGLALYATLTARTEASSPIELRLAYAQERLYVLFGGAAAYVTAEDLGGLVALFGGENM